MQAFTTRLDVLGFSVVDSHIVCYSQSSDGLILLAKINRTSSLLLFPPTPPPPPSQGCDRLPSCHRSPVCYLYLNRGLWDEVGR
jgi:hypothetical protein